MRGNDTSHDLPLFSWSPACKVIPFPSSRRLGKARRVAEVLEQKSGHDAVAYWKRIIGDLSRQLAAAGVARTVIDSELREFHCAVQEELERRSVQSSERGPGAA